MARLYRFPKRKYARKRLATKTVKSMITRNTTLKSFFQRFQEASSTGSGYFLARLTPLNHDRCVIKRVFVSIKYPIITTGNDNVTHRVIFFQSKDSSLGLPTALSDQINNRALMGQFLEIPSTFSDMNEDQNGLIKPYNAGGRLKILKEMFIKNCYAESVGGRYNVSLKGFSRQLSQYQTGYDPTPLADFKNSIYIAMIGSATNSPTPYIDSRVEYSSGQ